MTCGCKRAQIAADQGEVAARVNAGGSACFVEAIWNDHAGAQRKLSGKRSPPPAGRIKAAPLVWAAGTSWSRSPACRASGTGGEHEVGTCGAKVDAPPWRTCRPSPRSGDLRREPELPAKCGAPVRARPAGALRLRAGTVNLFIFRVAADFSQCIGPGRHGQPLDGGPNSWPSTTPCPHGPPPPATSATNMVEIRRRAAPRRISSRATEISDSASDVREKARHKLRRLSTVQPKEYNLASSVRHRPVSTPMVSRLSESRSCHAVDQVGL